MAEKSIGTIAAKVVANVDGWNAGIDGALKKLDHFQEHVSKMLSTPLRALARIPLLGASFAAIPVSAEGFLHFLEEGENRILAQARTADKLGISMKEAAGIKLLGGDRAEDLEKAIFKMQVLLGEARAGDASAVGKLRGIGLRPEDVTGESARGAYSKITTAIGGMGNAMDRAKASHDVFSKAAVGLNDVLMRGGQAWDNAANKAEAYGQVVEREAAEEIRLDRIRERQFQEKLKGMQTQLAKAASPIKGAALDVFTDLMRDPQDFFKSFWDQEARMRMAQHSTAEAQERGLKIAQAKRLGYDPEQLAAENKVLEDAVKKTEMAIRAQTAAFLEGGSAVAQLKLQLEGLTDDQAAHIRMAEADKKALENMFRQPTGATTIMGDFNKRLEALKSFHEAEPQAFNLDKAIEKLNDDVLTKMATRAQQFVKQTRDPLDAFKDELADIDEMLKKGFQFDEAAAKVDAFQKLAQKFGKFETFAPAHTYGSAGALDAFAEYANRSSPQQNVAGVMAAAQDAHAQRERTNDLLAAQLDEWRNMHQFNIP